MKTEMSIKNKGKKFSKFWAIKDEMAPEIEAISSKIYLYRNE